MEEAAARGNFDGEYPVRGGTIWEKGIRVREPLLAPLAALASGILISRLADFELRETAWALAALLALTGIARRWSTRRAALAAGLASILFVGVLVDLLHRPGPPPEIDAASREVLLIEGCVVEPPALFEDRAQFVLELEPGARARVSLYLKEGEEPPRLRYGQRVELEGRIRKPRNFQNPGSFDYASYLARKQIYWNVSARSGGQVKALPGRCGSRFLAAVFGFRASALERLDRMYPEDSYAAAILGAVLLGESSRLEKVWIEQFRRAGTYHALVISGLHVTVLAGFLLFLLRVCNIGQGSALLLASAAGWSYALLTGMDTPVVRAAGGLTLYLICGYFFRRRRLLNILAAIAIVFLAVDPEQMFDASFQLSFAAVAVIGALAVPLLERTSTPLRRGLTGLADRDRDLHLEPRVAQFRVELRLLAETLWFWTRLPQVWTLQAMALALRSFLFVYELAVVSGVIQIGLALPMAVYFHRVSLAGLTANPVVVTLMMLSVPAGFVAVTTGWNLAAWMAKVLLATMLKVVEWHAAWEPNWRIPDPPVWLALSVAASLMLTAIAFRLAGRLRVAAAALAGALFAIMLWHPFEPRTERGKLELTAIDVGQGESLLVALPEGQLILMDGGGIPVFGNRKKPRLDIGEDVVAPYLWSRSIRRLDVVAASHGHEDHIGGLAALIEDFRPRELWTGAFGEDAAWTALRQRAIRQGVKVVELRSGRRFRYGGADVEVLWPAPDYVPAGKPNNNDSLVLRLSHGTHSFLLTGDTERQGEGRMMAERLVERADVLKVAHHGGRTSTTQDFLDAARPAFAVISAGWENSYRLPHPDVLARLAEHQTTTFRTDIWGLITIRTDGRRFEVETRRWQAQTERRIARRSAF